ncbi:PAS domain S-box protein [Aromatoleum aromaticum]|uniref:PAS domain S-box protein n=1 Tax=Aromatoleum aromaticum TaxID=551760 RepID=UPI00138A28BE|nr:PAS domain S-box protein [Aromatoleum aromaticum]
MTKSSATPASKAPYKFTITTHPDRNPPNPMEQYALARPQESSPTGRNTTTKISTREDLVPYDLIFDNAIVGICFMRGRHFVKVNPKMEEMFGYGPGELNGKSVRTLYASGDDFDAIGRLYPTISRNEGYVHEKPMVRKNGEIFWCQISGRVVNPDRFASSVWVVQDISARKLAEDQLRRSKERLAQTVERRTVNLQRTNRALKDEVRRRKDTEREMIESREKYRALFRNIPMGILATDESGKVIEINPAIKRMFGIGRSVDFERVARDPDRVIIDKSKRLSLYDLIQFHSPTDGRRIKSGHVQWRKENGSLSEYEVTGIRLPISGLGAALVFEDVTDQCVARQREQEQQHQLAHATRLSVMGQFASALAHELGQPLNACQSYLAGLRHRLAPELSVRPDLREAVDWMDLHLTQSGDIVRNVRSFVTRHRPDNGEIELPTLISKTLELLHFHLCSARVLVNVQVAGDLPPVCGNRVEIQQVLINLVINAIEAMSEAPSARREIEIGLSVENRSQIAVRVSDSGVGVPSEYSQKIFEPYYTTKPSGLGLGLMMCRTILESHGGMLTLSSGSRGGATFKFVLPVSTSAKDEEEEYEPASSDSVPG